MPAVNYNKIKYFLYYFQIINLFLLKNYYKNSNNNKK